MNLTTRGWHRLFRLGVVFSILIVFFIPLKVRAAEYMPADEPVVASTSVKIKDGDKQKGTFSVVTGKIDTQGKVESVCFKVWCKGADIDAHKYEAEKKKNEKYEAVVDISNHAYHAGTYYIDVIVRLKDGQKIIAASQSYKFITKNFVVYGKTNGKFEKNIYIYNPTIKKKAYIALWSQAGNGEDKEIYKASYNKEKNRLEIKATMSKLKGAGESYIKLMKKQGSKYKKIKKYTFNVAIGEIVKSGWHYQKCQNGKTYKFYYKNGERVNNLTKRLKIKSQSKFYIEVNRSKCRVTVFAYDQETKSWCIPVIAFKCSVGLPSTPTPRGTFKTSNKYRWHELMGPSYGQYCTRITGGVLFHSVAGSNTTVHNLSARAYNRLGSPASHGCVRLCVRDAKWIYDYCVSGIKVKIFDAEYAGPLEPQFVPKMSAGQNYDPTDPGAPKNKYNQVK